MVLNVPFFGNFFFDNKSKSPKISAGKERGITITDLNTITQKINDLRSMINSSLVYDHRIIMAIINTLDNTSEKLN